MTTPPAHRTTHLPVHLALFGITVVWGLNLSVVKSLTHILDLSLIATLRMLACVACLTLLYRHKISLIRHWRASLWLQATLAGVLMVYVNQVLFTQAMGRTSATNAALIIALGPMVSASLEYLFFRRPMGRRMRWGLVLALIGVVTVITHRPGAQWQQAALGDVLIFTSVVTFAIGGALTQRISDQLDPMSMTWYTHVLGCALLCLDSALRLDDIVSPLAALNLKAWSMTLFSGLLATGLGAVIWAKGIATLGVGRTAAYLSWVPVLGVAFGALLLGEPVTYWHALGVGLVLIGTVLSWPDAMWNLIQARWRRP